MLVEYARLCADRQPNGSGRQGTHCEHWLALLSPALQIRTPSDGIEAGGFRILRPAQRRAAGQSAQAWLVWFWDTGTPWTGSPPCEVTAVSALQLFQKSSTGAVRARTTT